MSYWKLSIDQKAVLLDFVKGDTVWELGCGNLALAREMAVTARWVHAVDKNRISCRDKPDNVTFYRQHYHELQWPEWLDCVVTCWPMTCSAPGFMEILKRAFRVVYIFGIAVFSRRGNREWHLVFIEIALIIGTNAKE